MCQEHIHTRNVISELHSLGGSGLFLQPADNERTEVAAWSPLCRFLKATMLKCAIRGNLMWAN